jgi:hypothetical protein
MKKNFSKRRGQTLVEVMLALSLLMGLLGLLDLLSKSFYIDRVVSDQTKATYLAEEGVELAKNLIDHDAYLGLAASGTQGGWGDCIGNINGAALTYQLDFASMPTSPSSTALDGCPPTLQGQPVPLYFNSSTELYSQNPADGVVTNFTRVIKVTPVSVNDEYQEFDVQSIVTWNTGAIATQKIDLEDTFYNWYQSP